MSLRGRVSKWFVDWFGDVQVFPYPLFVLLWGSTQYRVKGGEVRAVTGLLEAGDVLLRRHDRYLSGWVIPGFYTHAALAISPDRVIHATTQQGVVEEDIFMFLRCDHVVVMRPRADDRKIDLATTRAESMIGKPYDFDFDSSDSSAVYCTEFVHRCYDGLFDELDGMEVIPPDAMLKVSGLEIVYSSKEHRERLKGGNDDGDEED